MKRLSIVRSTFAATRPLVMTDERGLLASLAAQTQNERRAVAAEIVDCGEALHNHLSPGELRC